MGMLNKHTLIKGGVSGVCVCERMCKRALCIQRRRLFTVAYLPKGILLLYMSACVCADCMTPS